MVDILRNIAGRQLGLDKDDNLVLGGTKIYFGHDTKLDSAVDLVSLVSLTGTGNTILVKSSVTFAADFQAANDALRDAGGGYIVLQAGGIYTLSANVSLTLDIGTGVGLQGNGATIYAPNHTNTTALILDSRPATSGFPIAGYDTGTANYFQKRVRCEGFALIGPADGIGTGTSNGIDVNKVAASSNRSPRANIVNVAVYGFHKNLCLRNQGYLVNVLQSIFTNGDYGVYFNGGANPSENTTFRDCTFGNNTIGAVWDTAAETGTAGIFDMLFDGCSFDYNAQQMKLITGNGRARFHGGNYEHNNGANTYAMDFGTGTQNNTCVFTFRDCFINYTGTAATGVTNYLNVGASVKVKWDDCYINSILGSGTTIGSPGTVYPALARVSGAGADFDCVNARFASVPVLAPLASLQAERSWLADPGFEQTTLADLWWVYKDAGAIVTTGSSTARTVSTNISGIVTNTVAKNGGARSLEVGLLNGNLAAGNRVIACLIPKRGDWFCGQYSYFQSAGSGTFTDAFFAVRVDDTQSQWSATNFSALAATNFIPLITLQSAALFTGTPTPTTTWAKRGLANSTNTNAPRFKIPTWATHILATFDLSALNNAAGTFNLDDFWITGF